MATCFAIAQNEQEGNVTRIDKAFAAIAAALFLLVSTGTAHAQPAPPKGPDFVRLAAPQPVASGEKIEVIEFFYYGCPVCYELEPALSRWSVKAPADVALRRVPALASASWENFARLFYSLEAMDELGRLHWPVYDNFHFEDISLNEEPVMFEWIARNGVEMEKFVEMYNSVAIRAKVAAARDLVRSYGVKGVPSFVVDGKFLTSANMAGGTGALMPVVDRLIDLARKERAR